MALTIRRLVMLVALYGFAAFVSLRPAVDSDLWWHLRTGQWIAEQGTVPTTDPFSTYGQGRPWIAYSWLFELLTYGLYQWDGLAGIVLGRLVLSLAVVVAVHRLVARREPRFFPLVGILALALLPLSIMFQERPWLFSILFYALTLDVVLDLRDGRPNWLTWLLPLLYALWANLHIQFIYGFALLGLACAAPVVDRLLAWGRQNGDTADVAGARGWWHLVVLTVACGLATLLNPYHVHLWALVVELATQTGVYDLMIELQALRFRDPWEWAVLAMTGLAAFALGRRAHLSAFEVLLLVSGAFFSFRARRDAWLVVIAAAANLATTRAKVVEAADTFVLTPLCALLIVAGTAVGLALAVWNGALAEDYLEKVVAARYPAAAVQIIKERGYPGPLYNSFDWGGYLIWHLPELPVSIDGRANLHGDERLRNSARVWSGERGWDADPDLMAARLIIGRPQVALASLLRLDRRFRLVHEDDVAAVFIRAEPGPSQPAP